MSTSNKEQYYTSASVGKSRRGSPGETSSVFFQGQGGRTVLPPISSAFPTSRFPVPSTYTTQYTQPRSSPGRFMLNQSAFYQWGAGNNSPPLPEPSFPNYETHDRYNTQPSYAAYPSARASSPIPQNSADSRRLPPLTTAAAGGDRWQQGSYPISGSYQTAGIRSPTASYPSAYAPYSTNSAYTYLPHSADQLEMNPNIFEIDPQVRSSSPYRSQLDTNFTPPPISPASATEEPTIKKKRKRADANQLKVLNEVYARTAFPSTEERNALAKQLDMSPRSVQIWFQNKRQSMRQTNRQSTNTSGLPQQSFSVAANTGSSQASSRGLGTTNPPVDPPYITSEDHIRAHHSSSPHRRDDVLDPRKWTSRGF